MDKEFVLLNQTQKVRVMLLQVDKIKFHGSEENNLMSVPGNFSPQELIGHFLWKKRQAGKKLATLMTRQTGTPSLGHGTEDQWGSDQTLFTFPSDRNYGNYMKNTSWSV